MFVQSKREILERLRHYIASLSILNILMENPLPLAGFAIGA